MEGVTEQVVVVDSLSLCVFIPIKKNKKGRYYYPHVRARFAVVGYGRLNRLIK
jgi:hypothetical protein